MSWCFFGTALHKSWTVLSIIPLCVLSGFSDFVPCNICKGLYFHSSIRILLASMIKYLCFCYQTLPQPFWHSFFVSVLLKKVFEFLYLLVCYEGQILESRDTAVSLFPLSTSIVVTIAFTTVPSCVNLLAISDFSQHLQLTQMSCQ